MKELWKPIKGYEGFYRVSNLGNIERHTPDGGWRPLKITRHDGQYAQVALCKFGVKEILRVHRLVAETFIGEVPKGYHVHHKDANKLNNCVANLEVLTPKKHRNETLESKPELRERWLYMVTIEMARAVNQYTKDGKFVRRYNSSAEASRILGLKDKGSDIRRVAQRQKGHYTSGGYIWRYADEEVIL